MNRTTEKLEIWILKILPVGQRWKNTLKYGPQPGVDNTARNSTSNETQLIVI